MEIDVIKERINDVLISVLGHNDFDMRDDMTAKDVDGWDSLSHMMIISRIEEEFHIKFRLRDLNKLKNMGSLVQVIHSKL